MKEGMTRPWRVIAAAALAFTVGSQLAASQQGRGRGAQPRVRKALWRGPTPETARRSTPSRRMRWRSSSDSATTRSLGYLHPHRLAHHLQSGAEDRRHAGQRRAEPEHRRRHLLSRSSRRADQRSAEVGAAGVREGRQGLRRGAYRAHRVRVVAGIRRDAGRDLRRSPLHGAGPHRQRATASHPIVKHWGAAIEHSDEFYRAGALSRDKVDVLLGSIRRARRRRSFRPTAISRWSGPRPTAGAASSTARCRTAPRPGTSGTCRS